MAILPEFACKQETTPGTAESLTSSEILIRLREGATVDIDAEEIDPREVQATSSKRPVTIGRKLVSFGVSYQLRGPGDLVTAPAIDPMLEAAMFNSTAAKTITCGSITSGPFLAGEVITSDGGGAPTGLVLKQTSASPVPYIPLSGTIGNTETITGSESGASATTTGTAQNAGFGYRPADSTFAGSDTKHHVTTRLNRNGFQWTARGALATLRMPFEVGQPCLVEQTFTGALTARGDLALESVANYPEAAVAVPRSLDASIVIGSYSPPGGVSLTFEMNNTIVPNLDINDSAGDGVRFADYTREAPTVTFDPDQVATTAYDYFTTFLDGTPFYLEWTHGSAAGSTWTFACREAQFTAIEAGERDNRPKFPFTARLNGTNNNEILIWLH